MPLDDAFRYDFADIFAIGQLVHTGGEHIIESAEAASERFGHSSADMQDAEPVKNSPHIALLARFDAVEKILRGFFTHAFEVRNIGKLQRVKVRDVAHEP